MKEEGKGAESVKKECTDSGTEKKISPIFHRSRDDGWWVCELIRASCANSLTECAGAKQGKDAALFLADPRTYCEGAAMAA